MSEIDWNGLREAAREAMKHSYSPYSNYPVGAAALTEDGRIVSGCNIENASYGISLCAECSLVSELFRTGGGKLVAFACVDGKGEALVPCGRCRQLLLEHAADNFLLDTKAGIMTMDQMLPLAFSRRDLDEAR